MNTILPYYLFTGFFLIAAVHQSLIGIYSNQKKMNLTFGGLIFICAIYEINMIYLLKANSAQEYMFCINASRLILIFSGIVQMFFVSIYCRIYFKKMMIVILGIAVLTLLITFFNPLRTSNIDFNHVHIGLINQTRPTINFDSLDMFVLLLNYLSLILFFGYSILVLIGFYKIRPRNIALLLISSFGVKLMLDLELNFQDIFHSIVRSNEYSNMVLIGAISLLILIELRNGVIIKQKMKLDTELKEFKNQTVPYIVHDFKTCLKALDTLSINDTKETILDLTKTCSENMLDIVENMLEVYKYNEGALKMNKSELEISGVIDEALCSVAHNANKKNIEFDLKLNGNCTLEADGDLIKRVFVNLLHDIIKCLTDNTRIIINSSYTHNNEFTFNLTTPNLNTSNLNANRLFEGNKLRKKDMQRLSFSTGISLMFCKIVVEGHNGEIRVENLNGKTSICLSFPNAYKNSAVKMTSMANLNKLETRNIKEHFYRTFKKENMKRIFLKQFQKMQIDLLSVN